MNVDIDAVAQGVDIVRQLFSGLEKGRSEFLHPLTQRYTYLSGGFNIQNASLDMLVNVLKHTVGDRTSLIEAVMQEVNQLPGVAQLPDFA